MTAPVWPILHQWERMPRRCQRLLLVAIVLLGAAVSVAKPALAQAFTEFPTPTQGSNPTGITSGPDGNLWFTEFNSFKIGRITTAGVITEFPIPSYSATIITTGPDGNLWFAETAANKIGRITTSGAVTEFPIPTATGYPQDITTGSDGALWFTEAGKIRRITTAGVFSEFPTPLTNNGPTGLTTGPDGALWFTAGDSTTAIGTIGRITTAGAFTNFPIATTTTDLQGITTGPDGALWFTEYDTGRIGRLVLNTTQELLVTPGTGIFAFGPRGGPFSPPSFSYTLIATSGRINFSISGVPNWLTPSPNSGNVSTRTAVTFTLNPKANKLATNTYAATINFINKTSGYGTQTRTLTLIVNPPSPP